MISLYFFISFDLRYLVSAAMKATKHVAFLAMLTTSVTNQHQDIHFDDVKLNVGNAYNPNHGNFIAPYNGTYAFFVTACSRAGHYVVLDFHVNNQVYDRIIVGEAPSFDACNSKTNIVSLRENDDVFLKHEIEGDVLRAYDPVGLPSFGGVFLFQE